MKNMEESQIDQLKYLENMGKKWKKRKFKSEKILKLWKKSKLKSEKMT